MKLSQIVLVVLISALTVVGMQHFMLQQTQAEPVKQSAYDRVKQTGILRCGYMVWPPFLQKDSNTGEISGVMRDMLEQMAQKLSLKIEWTTELGMADMGPALNDGRIDAFCGAAGVIGGRAREMDFTVPWGYFPIVAVGRANDPKYDVIKSPADLDNPDMRIIYLDGEGSSILVKNYTKAKTIGLQQLSQPAELFENIATNKADVGFFDRGLFNNYNATNPGKLKMLDIAPVGTFPAGIPVGVHEPELRRMLSAALTEVLVTNAMSGILGKYNIGPGEIIPVATPYMVP